MRMLQWVCAWAGLNMDVRARYRGQFRQLLRSSDVILHWSNLM